MKKDNSSHNFIPIKEIRDGIVILKNGQMCVVLLASSINFALRSSDEQTAILGQFQNFLNTIDFSLQIFVQSRELDIRPYIETLRAQEGKQDNDLMRVQLREYIEFIQTFNSEVDIMTKNFFVVVPYSPSIADTKAGVGENISRIFGKNKKEERISEERFAELRTQIEQRITVVEQGLSRIGVRTIPLGNDELIELYYHIYNPTDTSRAPVTQ